MPDEELETLRQAVVRLVELGEAEAARELVDRLLWPGDVDGASGDPSQEMVPVLVKMEDLVDAYAAHSPDEVVLEDGTVITMTNRPWPGAEEVERLYAAEDETRSTGG